MIRVPFALTGLALATVGCPLAAQTVWTVTSPTGIDAAIASASPGDVLVLIQQLYAPFTLDKGLVIRGNGAWIGAAAAPEVIIDVPAGQVAHVEGVEFTRGTVNGIVVGTPVQVAGGSVRFEGCTLSAGLTSALAITFGADVALLRSSVLGLGPNGTGIRGTGGSLALQDCEVRGASGGPNAPFPRLAAELLGTTLHAENSLLKGGDATVFGFYGAGALQVTVSAWLTDCLVESGASGVIGAGPVITNWGATPVALRRTVLVGPASTGPLDPTAPLVAFGVAPPWTRGAVSTLNVLGDPGAPFGIWLAFAAAPVASPFVVEPIWVAPAPAFAAGVLGANGSAAFAVTIPALPALQHLVVTCQAVSGVTLPARGSVIDGGVVR